MLRTITELVPFGNDSSARPITTMYLANVGRSKNDSTDSICDYVIAYYEPESYFSTRIRYFKYMKGYNRNASCFAMNHKIYGNDFPWMMEDEFVANYSEELGEDYIKHILSIFDKRATEDIGWNGDK